MNEELQHLGEQFRYAREGRNLSLKEVENSTSIRAGHLQSIEEGDLNNLISPVYAQGFIKKYASFLDLDGEAIIAAHPQVDHYLSQKNSGEYTFLESIEVRGSPSSQAKWLPNVLWIAGSMAGILVLWFFCRYIGFI